MGNYNIQCDIAMNDQKDERSVTVRELGCGVGPKLLCQPSHVLTEGGYTPTSKKSRRHFLEVRAALLRSTCFSVVGPKLLCFYPCVNGRG